MVVRRCGATFTTRLANFLGDVMNEKTIEKVTKLLQVIYELRQQGKPFDNELNQLIYTVLGRISC